MILNVIWHKISRHLQQTSITKLLAIDQLYTATVYLYFIQDQQKVQGRCDQQVLYSSAKLYIYLLLICDLKPLLRQKTATKTVLRKLPKIKTRTKMTSRTTVFVMGPFPPLWLQPQAAHLRILEYQVDPNLSPKPDVFSDLNVLVKS